MVKKPPRRPKADKEVDRMSDVFDGPIRNRRFGLRIDDEIDVTVIAGNTLMNVEGKLLSFNDDLELLDRDGFYRRIVMDWVVDIKVLKHNRPPQAHDPELSKKPVRPKVKKQHMDHAYS